MTPKHGTMAEPKKNPVVSLPPDYRNRQTVIEITLRLKTLGVPLDQYLITVTDFWDGNPKGFKFVCLSEKMNRQLCEVLDRAAPRIVKDAILSQLSQDGASWREVNREDSLHILWLTGTPNDTYTNPLVRSYFNVHLDSVSICRRADEAGRCQLHYPTVPRHIWKDLWHK